MLSHMRSTPEPLTAPMKLFISTHPGSKIRFSAGCFSSRKTSVSCVFVLWTSQLLTRDTTILFLPSGGVVENYPPQFIRALVWSTLTDFEG